MEINLLDRMLETYLHEQTPVTVVLQLFAYYAARVNGRSIDKPRNLAKSVTVE